MAQDEDFLRRWSRRKREAKEAEAKPAEPGKAAAAGSGAPAAPAALPPLDSLNFESDFKAFMHSKVEEHVKRAALKKLFSDPRFNVMDGLDVYIDDYSKGETLTPEMVAALEHAKSTLLGPKPAEEKPEPQAQADEAPPAETKDDGNPRQDA